MRRRWIAVLSFAAMAISLPGFAQNEKSIAVIPKGTTHVFWKSVHAGALKAEKEINTSGTQVKTTWQGPVREDDRNQQIQVVEANITKGTSAIVLAPLDARALRKPVELANQKKTPVVIIDSDIEREGISIVSLVATDNYVGGKLGGEQLAKLLGGKGNVVLLRYQVGSRSTEQREQGFLDAMKANPGIKIISDNQYAGATSEDALKKSGQVLASLKEPVDGIFCPNESSTFGMLRALQKEGKAGKVKFVGFDSAPKLMEALNASEINALVVQNPFKMGYEGVMAAWKALQNQKVEARIDTGCAIVTKDNQNEPKIQEAINPPLAEYLKE
jgi:ribose transport system substrate-binding protein